MSTPFSNILATPLRLAYCLLICLEPYSCLCRIWLKPASYIAHSLVESSPQSSPKSCPVQSSPESMFCTLRSRVQFTVQSSPVQSPESMFCTHPSQSRGGTTGAVQLVTDYSQQKHTTWAGRGRIIIALSKANCLSCTSPVVLASIPAPLLESRLLSYLLWSQSRGGTTGAVSE